MSLFMKTISPPIAAPAETEQDKLAKLRAELSEATVQRAAAEAQYFAALQAVRAEAPPYFRAAVERLSARVTELETAVSAAEREHERAVALARIAASRAALPQYQTLVGEVAQSLKDLRSALAEVREFRSNMEHAGTWAPAVLEGIDGILGEFSDGDRLNGAITQIETIAGQNGRFE
jgi:chromosome segregation ATPase